jgi:hypothetical protein
VTEPKALKGQNWASSASLPVFCLRRAQHGATPKSTGGSAQPIIPVDAGAPHHNHTCLSTVRAASMLSRIKMEMVAVVPVCIGA